MARTLIAGLDYEFLASLDISKSFYLWLLYNVLSALDEDPTASIYILVDALSVLGLDSILITMNPTCLEVSRMILLLKKDFWLYIFSYHRAWNDIGI
jgi:hypothetical protein